MMLNLLRGLGWTVPVAVLVPNALWAALPGPATPAPPPAAPAPWVRSVVPVEWVGRVAVFILPVFYRFSPVTAAGRLALGVMLLALTFYYTGWARYFTSGRNPVLLYKPLFGVPLPLAVSPVVYFLAASVALRSMPLAVGAVVFGSAHIAISAFNYGRLLVGSRASST